MSRRKDVFETVRKSAIWLVPFLLLVGPLLAANTPPMISTSIGIKAPDFQGFEAQLKGTADVRLANLCESWFGFLRWQAESVSLPQPVAGILMAQVVSRNTGGLSPQILLRFFFKRISGPPQDQELVFGDKILYESWDDQPTHNQARFQQHLLDALAEQFAQESFRFALHEQFLQSISLAQEVHVSKADERVLLPFAWEALQASRDSELEIRFLAARPADGQLVNGILALNPEVKHFGDPWPGSVQCVVKLYSLAPQRSDRWIDEVAVVLEPPRLKELTGIYMKRYQRDRTPASSGGTVTEPSAGRMP